MIDVASLYCDERTVTPDYRQGLIRVARSMRAAGVTPSTLQDSSFNRWLAGLSQSATTRSNYRRMGLTLWRHSLDIGLAEHYPRRIVRVKARPKPPVAWTLCEMARLVDEASKLEHKFKRSRCPANVFYRAFARSGYETGLRYSDLYSLRVEQIRDGRLWVMPNKTGNPVPKQLSAECVEDLRKLIALGDGERVFSWAICKRRAREHFKKLCRRAGIAGTPKFLRRTGATHCEIRQPGSAGRFLGHLSPGLAYRCYVDRTLLAEQCPTPPLIPSTT